MKFCRLLLCCCFFLFFCCCWKQQKGKEWACCGNFAGKMQKSETMKSCSVFCMLQPCNCIFILWNVMFFAHILVCGWKLFRTCLILHLSHSHTRCNHLMLLSPVYTRCAPTFLFRSAVFVCCYPVAAYIYLCILCWFIIFLNNESQLRTACPQCMCEWERDL